MPNIEYSSATHLERGLFILPEFWGNGDAVLIEIEDGRLANDVTSLLMGSDVPPRKEFIYEHAHDAELDV